MTDISFGCQTIHTGNVVAPDVRGRPRLMPWFGGEINPVSAKEAVLLKPEVESKDEEECPRARKMLTSSGVEQESGA